jgi:2-C-methyl-D-erythritol 2,4-cyclodiphosphate synthase
MKIKTGIGFDVHKFSKNRKLVLGGVHINYELGLLGHSDADVLIHAIVDSIAGVALDTDIGRLFPDTDNDFKNINSRIFLKEISKRLKVKNIKISNIDSVIIAQKPKISPFIDEMKKNIALDLGIDISDVSIKGTTTEYLGFTGRKEGIACLSITNLIIK